MDQEKQPAENEDESRQEDNFSISENEKYLKLRELQQFVLTNLAEMCALQQDEIISEPKNKNKSE